ncbi:MAG: NADH-quinone oxidoreductase subunit D [Planctomycetota bacterium]|nr:NADH-quinone oxidoreductase subunit D [Planctomycetota bacterium]MDA1140991.1 NADH-quinone oxidoreductase subunit D [Planctomycetota bacterium]
MSPTTTTKPHVGDDPTPAIAAAVEEARAAGKKIKLEEMYLNMGPQHPSTHGVLRLGILLEGEVIIDTIPDLGYLHRGTEKIAEDRDYMQIIHLTDRMDYLSAMNNNTGYVMVVEKLMGQEVPERAEYIRVMMQELNRIASHLLFFGTYGVDMGAVTPFLYGFRERELVLDIFEKVCGARMTHSYMRIGGVAEDLPSGFSEECKDFIDYFLPVLDEYDELLTYNPIFMDRTKGIGKLSKEAAIAYGVTGPMLRASGVPYDLRKDEPYSVYDKFEFDVPTGENGDCFDRYFVRIQEMRESCKIVLQALDMLPPGKHQAKTSRIIKPPVGEAYLEVENPRGQLGYYLVSEGEATPYRLHIRPPSFVNLQVLPDLLKGLKIGDVIAVLGSTDIVLGEVDR